MRHDQIALQRYTVRGLMADDLAGTLQARRMKDRACGADPHVAPAGEGTLPFEAIVGAGRVAGVDWYVVEQDEPADPLVDIGNAFRFLGSLAHR